MQAEGAKLPPPLLLPPRKQIQQVAGQPPPGLLPASHHGADAGLCTPAETSSHPAVAAAGTCPGFSRQPAEFTRVTCSAFSCLRFPDTECLQGSRQAFYWALDRQKSFLKLPRCKTKAYQPPQTLACSDSSAAAFMPSLPKLPLPFLRESLKLGVTIILICVVKGSLIIVNYLQFYYRSRQKNDYFSIFTCISMEFLNRTKSLITSTRWEINDSWKSPITQQF